MCGFLGCRSCTKKKKGQPAFAGWRSGPSCRQSREHLPVMAFRPVVRVLPYVVFLFVILIFVRGGLKTAHQPQILPNILYVRELLPGLKKKCWLFFFLISRHHPDKWVAAVSWLNFLILAVDLWNSSTQYLMKFAFYLNLDVSSSYTYYSVSHGFQRYVFRE